MFPYLILGLAVLGGLVLLGRWFATADPKTLATAVRWLLIGLAALFGLFVLLRGQWLVAAIIGGSLLPIYLRTRRMIRTMQQNAAGPSPRQASEVETRFLRMNLDHDSGELMGVVLAGAFAGRSLDGMSRTELLALYSECRAEEAQSASVLEAYLDRVLGADWRASDEAANGMAGDGEMTRAEAFEVLGLEAGANEAEIKAAHHRMINKVHPDHGGSTYLAMKINQAKELLLRG